MREALFIGLLLAACVLLAAWIAYGLGRQAGRQDEHDDWFDGKCGPGRHA